MENGNALLPLPLGEGRGKGASARRVQRVPAPSPNPLPRGEGIKVDLQISGMSCAACVRRVERALLRVDGVVSASVNLGTERARVAGSAAPAKLVAAVQAAGYGAELPDARPTAKTRFSDGVMALLACLFAAPLLVPMLAMPFGVDAQLPALAQLVLAGVVQTVFGARFYVGAYRALLAGTGSMDTLVALGTSAAFGLSAVQLATGNPAALYFEASAAVIALVRVGQVGWRAAPAARPERRSVPWRSSARSAPASGAPVWKPRSPSPACACTTCWWFARASASRPTAWYAKAGARPTKAC